MTLYSIIDWVNIDSGNGLLPVWHQAIAWTKVDLSFNAPLGIKTSAKIQLEFKYFVL